MKIGGSHALALGLSALFIFASGCASLRPVAVREPIEVTKIVYVRIDPGLTAACAVPMPRNNSGRELLRVAVERLKSLRDCNRRMEAIARIEGSAK